MSFLQAASGFATGFADELTRQQDIQREDDRRVEEELLANLRTQAQTYSERRRQHEEMLRNSHQLHQLTGVADPGAFFQILQLGINPREAIGMIQSNPNLFREMGINTTQEPPVGSQTGQPNTAIQPTSDVSMGRILPSGLYVSTGTRSQYSPSQNTINIAMDFNAAPSGDARGTEVIIPDNASPEVRAAAERFNALVADFARRNGIEDYPIRGIRTTSENGRGVRNTVHAEPFFNTDVAMQRAIQDNPAEFAMIYDQAFGGIPNARLIAPHGVGRDRGATSPVFGDETTFGELMANALLSQEQGQSPAGLRATVSTSGTLDPTDAQMSSAFSGQAPAPQGQPQQEQSGFDRFRTGVQQVFGMDDQSRQERIQSRVADRARSYGLTLGDGTGPSSGMGGGSGQGFASPPTNFRMNFEPQVDLSVFPSIASATDIGRLDAVVAQAEAQGLMDRPGADRWMQAVNAHRDALNTRMASSYLAGVNNMASAINARNTALADIESGAIPRESAEAVLAAIDRNIADLQDAEFSAPTSYTEARDALRVAIETGDERLQDRLIPYVNGLSDSRNPQVTRVIVRPTDGSVGRTVTVTQRLNTQTGEYEYQTLSGQPVEVEGAVVVPMNEDIRRAAAAVQGNNKISIMYRDGTQSVADLSRYLVPMFELAELMADTPEVATYASQLAVGIDSFFRDTRSLIGMLERVSRERDLTPQEAEQVLRQNSALGEGESLESLADSFTASARSGVIENMADARRAYEAYILLGTFRTGGIEGQEGRAVSNRLFEELQDFMRNARDVDQLRDRVRVQADGMVREIAQSQQAIVNHPIVRGFISEFGYNPVEFGTLSDVLAADPRLEQAVNYFMNTPVRGASTAPQTETPGQDTSAGILITPEMVAQTPSLSRFEGRYVRAVPQDDGTYALEVVE